MNIFKKITAVILICLSAFTLIGCHTKNETAVTIDGNTYTSAYYMCALINAYSEAQTEVYSNLSEEAQTSGDSIDYLSQKIDNKDFSTWTKDRAIEILQELSFYKSACEKNNLELSEDEKASTEYYASLYWSSYGYSTLFEPNGVSEKTYTQYLVDGSYSSLYFEHVYGKDGEKEIKAKDVKSYLYKNFILADVIDVDFSDETENEIAEIEKKLKNYEKKLKNGKMTFEEVYIDYNELDEDHNHDDEEDSPKDPHATVIGDEGTGYEHDYYDDIKKLNTDEVKLIEKDNNEGFVLVVKKNIKDDDYYLENLDITVRHLLKDDEFNEETSEEAHKLKANIRKYAVNQFKVKNIVEPEYS